MMNCHGLECPNAGGPTKKIKHACSWCRACGVPDKSHLGKADPGPEILNDQAPGNELPGSRQFHRPEKLVGKCWQNHLLELKQARAAPLLH